MGSFRHGICNTRAKTKLDVENMKFTTVARLVVVSKC